MDNSANGAPDGLEPISRINYEREPAQNREPRRAQPAGAGRDQVERQLAQYGFTREERDREVRLLLRDVAADEVAISFRAAGATFITLAGERDSDRHTARTPPRSPGEDPDYPPIHRHRRATAATTPPTGELTMRYFYALGETVYTISITTTSEVVSSIASVFPAAMLLEREAQERLAVVFRSHRL